MDPGVGAVVLSPVAEPATSGPFDHAGRRERAREALARARARGLIVTPGANLRYLSGVAAGPSERLVAFLLPVRGEPLLVAPAFERDRLEAELAMPVELAVWSEGADPFAAAAPALNQDGWLIDPAAPFWVAGGLEERGVRVASGAPICAALRRRKEPEEVERLRRAQALTRGTLAGLTRTLAPKVTERELAWEIIRSFHESGAEGWALVQFGEGSARPHGEPGERPLAEECAVLVDLGAVVDGYHGDLTRAWWFGERPAAGYGRAAGAVERAHSRAAALARAGALAGDLDKEARTALAEEGLAERFLHRLGHGIGLEIHEEPFLVEGSQVALEAGDVFTIEPGVYLPDEFGVRHEDVWWLGDEGAFRL